MKFPPILFLLMAACAVAADDKAMGVLLQKYRHSVVLVKGAEGGGSAFIAKIGKGTYLITNQHIVAGIAKPEFSLPDRTEVKVGTAAGAIGHDIMSFGLDGEFTGIEVMQGVDQFAAVGDDVVVLGNPDAGGVIHPIAGKLVGIGPKLVEVSAEFVAGNSGSPIIHVKTGQVIGVATFIKWEDAELTRGREHATVRRFGYRLDSIKQWEKIIMWQFNDESETVKKVHQRTAEIVGVLRVMQKGRIIEPELVEDPSIKESLAKLQQGMANAKTKEEYSSNAAAFVSNLAKTADEDLGRARQRVGYDYLKEKLAEEEKLREPIAKGLEVALKAKPWER